MLANESARPIPGRRAPVQARHIPALVIVHGSDVKKIAPTFWIRVRECVGGKWSRVLVTEVHPDGYFKADR